MKEGGHRSGIGVEATSTAPDKGNCLVHWVLTPDELRAYAGEVTRQYHFWARLGLAGLVVLSIVFAVTGQLGPMADRDPVRAGMIDFAKWLGGSVALYGLAELAVWAYGRELVKLGRDVLVKKDECYFAKHHTRWNDTKGLLHRVLEDARVERGDAPMLVLTVATRLGNSAQDTAARAALRVAAGAARVSGYVAPGPGKQRPKVVRLPIPRGREAEAQGVAARLMRERIVEH
jgi:hypothetical protein